MKTGAFSLVLFAGVLALSIWSLWPGEGAEFPGMLRFGVYDGRGGLATEQAASPLADYLGLAIRRSVRVVVLRERDPLDRVAGCELALVPASQRERFPDYELLAHAKGHGRVGQLPRAVLVRRPGGAGGGELMRGDAFSWLDDAALADRLRQRGFERPLGEYASGHDPYDHSEALAALAHGACDAALVRDGDLAAALADGVLQPGAFESEVVGERAPAFVLLARQTLNDGTRQALRRAALELDHLRLDEASLRVQVVVSALGQLGIHGFVPVEPFPGLRP